MLNSLDALIVTFFAMSFISILGVILMFLVKNEKWKKGLFYGLSIWGLVVEYCNVQTHFSYMIGGIAMALGFGAFAVAAILVKVFGKSEKSLKAAQLLAAVSVAGGMIDLFFM